MIIELPGNILDGSLECRNPGIVDWFLMYNYAGFILVFYQDF